MSLATGYQCIYCGKSILSGTGLSCSACNKKGRDEWSYADELEPKIGQMMKDIEEKSNRVEGSWQTKEEAFRLHEENVQARKEYQLPDQEEMKERRTGRIIHMNNFLDRLRSLGINAWFTERVALEGTLGLFVHHEKGIKKCSEKHDKSAPHYVCFVQAPYMQEYEEWYFDDYNVPKGIRRRGWRTVLLNLIEQRIITEQEAHSAYGEPSGAVSLRYKKYLQYLRGLPE